MAKKEKQETTFYRFLSEIKGFLASLLRNPIKAKPHKYLVDRGFGKDKLIMVLIKRGIMERHEKILDSTNSDEKEARYIVKYKVRKQGFEKKIHRIFSDYFEENLPDDEKKVDEGMTMPLISRPIYMTEKDMKRKSNHKGRSVFLTEAQVRYIKENICTPNRADILNEEGEGGAAGDGGTIGGATTTGPSSGEVIRTRKGSVGPFEDNGDGFFDGATTTSDPVMMGKKK